MACYRALVAAVVLRGDRRKRLADPLGRAADVADVAVAAVAVAAAASPWCHRSPFSLHLLNDHVSPHHLAPSPHVSPYTFSTICSCGPAAVVC